VPRGSFKVRCGRFIKMPGGEPKKRGKVLKFESEKSVIRKEECRWVRKVLTQMEIRHKGVPIVRREIGNSGEKSTKKHKIL